MSESILLDRPRRSWAVLVTQLRSGSIKCRAATVSICIELNCDFTGSASWLIATSRAFSRLCSCSVRLKVNSLCYRPASQQVRTIVITRAANESRKQGSQYTHNLAFPSVKHINKTCRSAYNVARTVILLLSSSIYHESIRFSEWKRERKRESEFLKSAYIFDCHVFRK